MSSHVPWQNGRWLTGTRHAFFAVLLPAATIPPAARRWRFADAGVPMLALLATARTRKCECLVLDWSVFCDRCEARGG